MKRTFFVCLCLAVTLLSSFSGAIDANKGSYTIEGKTYVPVHFFSFLPDTKSSYPYFAVQGWMNKTTPYYGSYSNSFKGDKIPPTGTYPLKDYAQKGEASILISTPNPKEKNYRAQSGEIQVVNNGSTITFKFTNVPVKSDIGNFTDVASGTMTFNLK